MKDFIKNMVSLKNESDGGSELAEGIGVLFYLILVVALITGTIEAVKEDQCTIERVAELHPAYITGCLVFGKSLPGFKIFGGDK